MAETAMAPAELRALGFSVDSVGQLVRYVQATEVRRASGPCVQPIRLVGSRTVLDRRTGEVLSVFDSRQLPGGAIAVPCGNRRASVCQPCSTLYKYDAYNLVVSGLRGGKDTPADVSGHPRLFVTVTAPSFGPVHLGPDKGGTLRQCHPRRTGPSCGRWHAAGDPLIGTPIDPPTYDYAGHAVFNALASALWSRTSIEIRRVLADLAGLPRRALKNSASVVFAKVAEYQVRGIVHFHAVVRLDGPDGPGSALPSWASGELLAEAVRLGVERASVPVPVVPGVELAPVVWGRQIDVRPVLASDLASGELSDVAVARYVAKYATKSAESAGVELPRLSCAACSGLGRARGETAGRLLTRCPACRGKGTKLDLDAFDLGEHARRLVETCWELGGREELADLKLRRWAHMLGFRGHFATKSRTYSTTFGALRQERADYVARTRDEALDLPQEPDSVVVVNHWLYAGRDQIDFTRPPDEWADDDMPDLLTSGEETP